MSDLAEFLLARIAECAELAHQMQTEVRIFTEDPGFTLEWLYAYSTRHASGGSGSGFLRSVYPDTPEDVLAECEAKRRIVAEYVEAAHLSHRLQDEGSDEKWEWIAREAALERVVRLLALPYADHPDYREEWKP